MSLKLPSCIAVIGLGYVGLPLAAAFARHLRTIGFDVDRKRVDELRQGYDRNGALTPEELQVPLLSFTSDPTALYQADFFVVAVPTPVDTWKRPDLQYLLAASRIVGQALRVRAEQNPFGPTPIVVYESTVYPGCTEEVCVPILEQESGLVAGRDFKVGYSPERINPGDREHTLEKVVKVVAGQDEETTEVLAQIYSLVALAGVYKAPDIRTAEAAKVIENVQRDLNIALMNELAMLFHRLGLNTREVLAAARTKWNFLPFEPGLVGGHCIPVDPYYLAYKAQEVGYHPELILAGRRINDRMGEYVAHQTVRLLIQNGKNVRGASVLVLGVTFKENVPDIRNSRVFDLIAELERYGCVVSAYDPFVSAEELRACGLTPAVAPYEDGLGQYDAVVVAVAHKEFREKGLARTLALLSGEDGVLVDVKGLFAEEMKSVTRRSIQYWHL